MVDLALERTPTDKQMTVRALRRMKHTGVESAKDLASGHAGDVGRDIELDHFFRPPALFAVELTRISSANAKRKRLAALGFDHNFLGAKGLSGIHCLKRENRLAIPHLGRGG